MDSIKIDAGVKRILINDGPAYIEFNPSDINFAERFYELVKDFQAKKTEYQRRSEEIDANIADDSDGIPANLPDGLALMREACEFVRERIDRLFGKGTCQKSFGDALSLDMFMQFFDGVSPYIQRARTDKASKYAPPPASSKRHKRAVMK